ncbi:MAG: Polyamine-transporting ATPase [Cyanobacteria bacterium RYN_339]|nr:Polyamine-transporting ATPase [Cyanobacteria bacterium RYN_339]
MSTPSIAFEHVSFQLPGGRTLLEDLNLEVQAGETLVLLGRSGSGKTTTMRMINRMLEPTGGVLRVQGTATTAWDPIKLRRRVGYVIQEAGLFPHQTVAENVGLVPRLEGWEPGRIRARVDELLALVGLDPAQYGGRFPRELSGGQRQRVGIARALAADPPIMLLDEPFSALDPITRRDIQLEFKALQRRLGKTLVFVTHDVREALVLATRIGLMRDGKLQFLGTPTAFLASADDEVRAFLACIEPEAEIA